MFLFKTKKKIKLFEVINNYNIKRIRENKKQYGKVSGYYFLSFSHSYWEYNIATFCTVKIFTVNY